MSKQRKKEETQKKQQDKFQGVAGCEDANMDK